MQHIFSVLVRKVCFRESTPPPPYIRPHSIASKLFIIVDVCFPHHLNIFSIDCLFSNTELFNVCFIRYDSYIKYLATDSKELQENLE